MNSEKEQTIDDTPTETTDPLLDLLHQPQTTNEAIPDKVVGNNKKKGIFKWKRKHRSSVYQFIYDNIDVQKCKIKDTPTFIEYRTKLRETLPIESVDGIDISNLPSAHGFSRVFNTQFDRVIDDLFDNGYFDTQFVSDGSSDEESDGTRARKRKRKKRKKKKKRREKRRRSDDNENTRGKKRRTHKNNNKKKPKHVFKYDYSGNSVGAFDDDNVKWFLNNSIDSFDSDYSFKCSVNFKIFEK